MKPIFLEQVIRTPAILSMQPDNIITLILPSGTEIKIEVMEDHAMVFQDDLLVCMETMNAKGKWIEDEVTHAA